MEVYITGVDGTVYRRTWKNGSWTLPEWERMGTNVTTKGLIRILLSRIKNVWTARVWRVNHQFNPLFCIPCPWLVARLARLASARATYTAQAQASTMPSGSRTALTTGNPSTATR